MMFTGNPAQLANYFGANRVDRLVSFSIVIPAVFRLILSQEMYTG
jgi:hypothetical protein